MADERLAFEPDSPWKGEHYFRYAHVSQFIGSTDRLLDIACGTGYGTYRLALLTANTVIGGDISDDAINSCKTNWDLKNLAFRRLDGTKLDLDDSSVDRIISFETIEHTPHYLELLSEFRRVLNDRGTLYLSTPNILVNSPTGVVTNPFHTQEFELDKLEEILRSAFDIVEIYGQKYQRRRKRHLALAGRIVEMLFSQRVIRRTPLSIKNRISHLFNGKPFYPQEDDFVLVSQRNDILRCQTFFCICKKQPA